MHFSHFEGGDTYTYTPLDIDDQEWELQPPHRNSWGLVSIKSEYMEYCNAGHNPPLLDGEFMKMESNAPIGLWPEVTYAGEKVNDMHGKTLFVYTDGINEAENTNKEQFGDARLKALLQQDWGTARQTSEAIHKAVEEFVGGAEPSDDLTKMCIKL